MIYIHVDEMCFILMNVHNELFYGVRQLRCQHLSPVVSTFSTSIRLLSSFFIQHCVLHSSSSLCLSICLTFCGTPSSFPNNYLWSFPAVLEMLMFSSCNPKFLAVRHIQYPLYPVNPSSDHFHTDAVVPS